MSWPELRQPTWQQIHQRLQEVLPAELDERGWMRREMGGKVLFVLLHGFAIEGEERWMRPTAVTDMTDEQARVTDPVARRAWLDRVQGRGRPRSVQGGWYQENSREPIRDETLRSFTRLGIVIERPGVPTTSPLPRYALQRAFCDLLDPELSGEALELAIASWCQYHLSREALARVAILRRVQGQRTREEGPLVELPNGETRRLASGPSSLLTKAVIEEFAPRFLGHPAVLLISESARKLVQQDEELCTVLGFRIDPSRTLPDVVLVDVAQNPPLLVFVECVHSDGPVDEGRLTDLHQIAVAAGWSPANCACVTAFADRSQSPFRGMASSLAWGSYAWFQSEPDNLLILRRGEPGDLQGLSWWERGI